MFPKPTKWQPGRTRRLRYRWQRLFGERHPNRSIATSSSFRAVLNRRIAQWGTMNYSNARHSFGLDRRVPGSEEGRSLKFDQRRQPFLSILCRMIERVEWFPRGFAAEFATADVGLAPLRTMNSPRCKCA